MSLAYETKTSLSSELTMLTTDRCHNDLLMNN